MLLGPNAQATLGAGPPSGPQGALRWPRRRFHGGGEGRGAGGGRCGPGPAGLGVRGTGCARRCAGKDRFVLINSYGFPPTPPAASTSPQV